MSEKKIETKQNNIECSKTTNKICAKNNLNPPATVYFYSQMGRHNHYYIQYFPQLDLEKRKEFSKNVININVTLFIFYL